MENAHLDLVLVFFIYGLAFFTLGLALLLETGRTPRLAEGKLLRLLSLFGLLHGMHEWLEIILLQGVWLSLPFPPQLSLLRVSWLALSFLPLMAFASLTFLAGQPRLLLPGIISLGFLVTFLLGVLALYLTADIRNYAAIDGLARYFLAVPGSLLAGFALRHLGRDLEVENSRSIARHFYWTGLGFALYGLTQVFVPPGQLLLSPWLNSDSFQSLFGIPVQLVRGGAAVFITFHLIRAIQLVERERARELQEANMARLQALEQVQRELMEREALRRELLRHTVIAQEDERARIARELHDETAQLLTGFSLNLAIINEAFAEGSRSAELLSRLQSLSRQISESIYRLVHDLRPAQLDDLGLAPALEHLCEEEQRRVGVRFEFHLEGSRRRLDPLVETVFFRVAQEALTNVARHAHVDSARLELLFLPNEAVLRVRDEGIGFDTGENQIPPRGWGLAGMRERADSIGARMRIHSVVGQGTTVEIRMPLENSEEIAMEKGDVHDPLDAC